MSLLGSLIGPVADLGKTWLEGKVAKTKAKAEAEAARERTSDAVFILTSFLD